MNNNNVYIKKSKYFIKTINSKVQFKIVLKKLFKHAI